ncbi:phospholipid carrier-dependent glycosyltransferase [Pseudonocardiaceae bacterium YIM PH 21723]|nr:phospholipid carrier-dependent glycosyltransferase [Pseudonocardiaceae bacterium YIM PH 21723]
MTSAEARASTSLVDASFTSPSGVAASSRIPLFTVHSLRTYPQAVGVGFIALPRAPTIAQVTTAIPNASTAETADGVVGVGETPQTRELERATPQERLGPPMPDDRLRDWITTLIITGIGFLVRLWNLGHATDKGTPSFDEKYYAPQGFQMLRNGGYEDNQAYEVIVHPPVGKQLIALGEWIFGYTPWGWRFSAAICGSLMIFLVIRIARRLTRSTLLGGIAGILLICDGVSHVQSRIGMLDIFLAFFVLAAFWCLLVDRDQMRDRMRTALDNGWLTEPFGPRLGFRWWRFAAGVSLGLALGTKWSALYFVAAFGLLTFFWDYSTRRTAGLKHPLSATIRRDLLPALGSIVALSLVVYLATWWSWYGSETAVDRHAVDGRKLHEDLILRPWTEVAPDGLGSLLPGWLMDPLRSLGYYSWRVYDFHTHLFTKAGSEHPWESKPWGWPMGLRPMLYNCEGGPGNVGCGGGEYISAVMLIGTPAMWWLAFPMLAWLAWRSVISRDWRHASVLAVYLAGWLPWFIDLRRQMYYFYTTPMAPFLVLGLTLVLGEILGRAKAGAERRSTGLLVVAFYVGLVVANFAWLWPILNGEPISLWRWNAELWLPSWR